MATTENTKSETPAEEPQEATGSEDASTAEEQPQDDDTRGNREAAKYRKQLRETQGELEQIRSQLAAAQQAVLSAVIPELRVMRSMQLRPEALRELNPQGMFNDDGTLNIKAVQVQIDAIYKDRPYLFQKNFDKMPHVPNAGKHPESTPMGDPFERAFTPSHE